MLDAELALLGLCHPIGMALIYHYPSCWDWNWPVGMVPSVSLMREFNPIELRHSLTAPPAPFHVLVCLALDSRQLSKNEV